MRSRLVLAVLLPFALATAACGARLTDEQLATVNGDGSDTGVLVAGGGTGGSDASGASDGSTSSGGTAGSAGSAGTAGSSGGTGGSDASTSGGDCTPQPTDAVGITDSTITLANLSTISGPIAGFGETGVNAVKAYVNYVNATGGVCGRTIDLITGDDRLDAGVNRSETQRLSGEAFGFVGDVTVVDDGGAEVLQGTDIPDVSLAIGSKRARLANNFSPNPINPDAPGNGTIPIMQYFVAHGVTSAAVVNPAQADARTRAQAYVSDMNAAGITTVDTYEVAVSESNYVNVAQQIENKGSQLVITTLEISGMVGLAKAFDQIDYHPQYPFYGAQAYGQAFIDRAGAAAEGTTLAVTHALFGDAGSVPAMANFLDWYQRTAPGSQPDFFAVMSWAAADMFVTALRAAGPAPTRASVVAALGQLTSYTGDGFMAPRNPAAKTISGCFAIVQVVNGEWTRLDPAAGFLNC